MLDFIIRRKTFVSMLFIGLSMLGYISYTNLPVELLPNVELPFLIVSVNTARELDPEQMERESVIPLEAASATLEGIEKIESFVERRSARIIVYFQNSVNLKYAYLRLQEKVDQVKSTLPDNYFVNVVKIDTDLIANMFMNIQVRGGGGVNRIRHLVDRDLVPELESIDGVANVEVFGGQNQSVDIELDPQVADTYNLTPSRIRSLIASNAKNKVSLGKTRHFQKNYYVNLIAEYRDLKDIEDVVIDPLIPLRIGDVATVSRGQKEETSISRVNGKESVTIQLVRDSQVNMIALSHRTRETLDRLNREQKDNDVELVVQLDMAESLEENMDLIINLALTGGLLAILILWIFLKNLRLVLVVAISLPVSIFTAYNLFYAFDISINSLSLVGMALAVGMLVDNSIVVLENIYRKLQDGSEARIAVIQGTKEVARSIIAATLTTITVFLPFLFAENFFVRILGYHIGVSIISTLLISLVVALVLIPMMVYSILQATGKIKAAIAPFPRRNLIVQMYTLFLKSVVRFPRRTIILTIVLFFFTLLWAVASSMDETNEAELQDFNLYLTMPGGATLDKTDATTAELEKMLENVDGLKDVVSQIYEEESVLTLKVEEAYLDESTNSIADIKENISERLDNFRAAEVGFEQPESSTRFRGGGNEGETGFENFLGIAGKNEYILIKGRDYEVMRRLADDLYQILDDADNIQRVRINQAQSRPEIHLIFDKLLMYKDKVSLAALNDELNSFEKEITTGTKFKDGDEEYDITIKTGVTEDKSVEDLRRLQVPSETGATYRLENLSHILFSEGAAGINRVNQEREIKVTYRFNEDVNDNNDLQTAARAEIEDMLADLEIPAGIAVEVDHNDLDLSDFYFLITVALILIFMILASVFESLLNPLVIMFTIPLAAIGSLIGIILTGKPLMNVNTLVGFLILLGIVVNNGIILIDTTRQNMRKGFRRERALIAAGQARLRPIMITAITTIIAMLPLAMGKLEYVTRIASPFAVTVIGGLMFSTAFTLLIIPSTYSALNLVVDWFRTLNRWIQIVQIVLIAAGAVLIYNQIDSLIWRYANFFLVLFVVPGLTAFIRSSLRHAQTDLIDQKSKLSVRIQFVHKLYDQPGHFLREWQRKKKNANIASENREALLTRIFWQFSILGFGAYFIFEYLGDGFWFFVLNVLMYYYVRYLVHSTRWKDWYRFGWLKEEKFEKWRNRSAGLIIWSYPLMVSTVLYLKWDSLTGAIILGLLWYLLQSIHSSARSLQRSGRDANRISGKFARTRRLYYRAILALPLIGKQKQPFAALKGISLDIENGMFGLLGPNGAGKTTLMRIICGILEPSYGSVFINQFNTREHREELQGMIGYLPQEFGTYENMTVTDYLNYQAILKGISKPSERAERIDFVLRSVHLEDNSSEKIGSFSGGMKQRVGIAQTLLHLPRILVVDEPTAGLDPRERIRFRNLLVELSRERIVIFSTHIIEDIASSCDRVAVLNKGEMKYLGAPDHMVTLARGHVWQCLLEENEFESTAESMAIVHHTKVKEKVRVRLLAEDQPLESATQVKPTLEDAYLWLLRSNNGQGAAHAG